MNANTCIFNVCLGVSRVSGVVLKECEMCSVNIVYSPLKLLNQMRTRQCAAGALFKSVWKPHDNI